jgi:hypothetical protein
LVEIQWVNGAGIGVMAEEGLQYKGIEALFVLILKKDV